MMNFEEYIKAEKYLKGQMSPEEVTEFEKNLSEDPAFQADYASYKEAQSVIMDKGLLDLKTQITSYHQKYSFHKKLRNYITGGTIALIVVAIPFIALHKSMKDDKSQPIILKDSAFLQTDTIGQINNNKLLQDNSSKSENKKSKIILSYTVEPGTSDQAVKSIVNKDSLTSNLIKNDVSKPAKKDTTATIAKKSVNKTVDCSSQTITAKTIQHKDACAEKADGEISIIPSGISGGTPPYKYSTDNNDYSANPLLTGLAERTYTVYIKDRNNCVGEVKNINIKSRYCDNEFVFAPLRGELWSIPLHSHTSGEISIYSKTNQIVYTAKIVAGDSWNGTDNNNNQQSGGLYKFIIRYENGETFNGFITIVE